MSIMVYLPTDSTLPAAVEHDIKVVRYESSAELVSLLATNGNSPAVVVTAGITEAEQETLAAAIHTHGIRVIEVREERWDGFSASPLSAACRGVIAGFGANGIAAAIAALRVLNS